MTILHANPGDISLTILKELPSPPTAAFSDDARCHVAQTSTEGQRGNLGWYGNIRTCNRIKKGFNMMEIELGPFHKMWSLYETYAKPLLVLY